VFPSELAPAVEPGGKTAGGDVEASTRRQERRGEQDRAQHLVQPPPPVNHRSNRAFNHLDAVKVEQRRRQQDGDAENLRGDEEADDAGEPEPDRKAAS